MKWGEKYPKLYAFTANTRQDPVSYAFITDREHREKINFIPWQEKCAFCIKRHALHHFKHTLIKNTCFESFLRIFDISEKVKLKKLLHYAILLCKSDITATKAVQNTKINNPYSWQRRDARTQTALGTSFLIEKLSFTVS